MHTAQYTVQTKHCTLFTLQWKQCKLSKLDVDFKLRTAQCSVQITQHTTLWKQPRKQIATSSLLKRPAQQNVLFTPGTREGDSRNERRQHCSILIDILVVGELLCGIVQKANCPHRSWRTGDGHHSTCGQWTWQYMTLHDSTRNYMTLHNSTQQYRTVYDSTWQFITVLNSTWQYMTVDDSIWQ